MDYKRVLDRAIAIDIEESTSPLTDTQWEAGLDMLERRKVPLAGSGIAMRQERIVRAIDRARAELDGEMQVG